MKWNCLNFSKKELLFFWFLKGTEIILEFIYIYTEMEMYFHLGTLCNSAFIKIISSKWHNMRITYDTALELILFLFFFILLMIIKLSIVHNEKLSVRTQTKLDFPGGLENVICMLTFQCPLPHSLWPIWKEPLHFRINVFCQNPPNPKSSLVVHLLSVPPSPAALLPEKPVLTTGFWSQAIDFSLQRPSELKLAVSMQS